MVDRKLYGNAFSSAMKKVLACLYENDLEFEFVPIDLKAGEHKKQPFLSLNPFGQVPVYLDGDFAQFESRAIIRCMDFEHYKKEKEMVYLEPKKQGIVAIWIDVEDHQFEPTASKLISELLIKPMTGLPTDEAVVVEMEDKLAKVFDIYEAQLTKFKYLASNEFTIADLLHLPHIHYLMETLAKKLLDSRSRVSAWCADILARPAWAEVIDMQKNFQPKIVLNIYQLRKCGNKVCMRCTIFE